MSSEIKNTMTESTTTTHNNSDSEAQIMASQSRIKKRRRRRCCCLLLGLLLLLVIIIFIVALVLALTLFKAKDPTFKLVSASLDGVSPSFSFPRIQVHLNITLDLNLTVHNPNQVSFKHGQGNSVLFYRGNRIGDTEIFPGVIPAKGSALLSSRLTLQVDRVASNVSSLIGDLLGGELSMESSTRLPGRVTILGFIKRHIVTKSECQFTIGVFDRKIRSQSCRNKAKF